MIIPLFVDEEKKIGMRTIRKQHDYWFKQFVNADNARYGAIVSRAPEDTIMERHKAANEAYTEMMKWADYELKWWRLTADMNEL